MQSNLSIISPSIIFDALAEFVGDPSPHITWYHDEFELTPNEEVQMVTTSSSSTLQIGRVCVADAGTLKYSIF